MYTILLRTLLVYITVVIAMRAMGRRQVGELEMSELVAALLLSQVASLPIEEPDIPFFHALIPILLILAFEILLTFLKNKIPWLKTLFEGTPAFLLKGGRIDQKELAAARMSVEELFSELRQQGYAGTDDVYTVVLEGNGKISVFPKAEAAPLTPRDMALSPKETGVSLPLITDGIVNEENLKHLGKDRAWLSRELTKRKVRCEDTFLLAVNEADEVSFCPKEEP